MPDIDDVASEQEEFARTTAQSMRKPEGPPVTGFCHFCDAEVEPPKRWCDADCKEDWDRNQRLKGRA